MKATSSVYSLIFLLLLLGSISATSQTFSKEGKVSYSYALEKDTEIEITNKYGDITVENWDIDSVKIEINYKVSATQKSNLKPVYDAIAFDIKGNEYYIVCKTVFEGRGSFWFDISEIANNLFAAGIKTSIDYTVYIPANGNLNLNLKYGSIYMADFSGDIDVTLSNGNYRAHNLTGNTNLDVNFGDVTIKEVTTGTINIRYGTLDLQTANDLTILGQSSEFDMGKIDKLSIDFKRSKVYIESAGQLSGDNYFTKLNVDNILNTLNISNKYGSFKLNKIASGASNIQFKSYNTSVNFYFTEGESYAIKLISDNKADVSYSSKLGEFAVKKLPNKLKQAECKCGTNKNKIPINIEIKSGMLTLKVH